MISNQGCECTPFGFSKQFLLLSLFRAENQSIFLCGILTTMKRLSLPISKYKISKMEIFDLYITKKFLI